MGDRKRKLKNSNNKIINGYGFNYLEALYKYNYEKIWELYEQNPLTKGFCCQGLEPFDSPDELLDFVETIRYYCDDPIIIYTGYSRSEIEPAYLTYLQQYENIIIKWGRFILGQEPHYDKTLGVKLASNNQYAELI